MAGDPTVSTGDAGVVVVGYAPSPVGLAALRRAVAEATATRSRLVIVGPARGEDSPDPALEATLEECPVPVEIHQLGGRLTGSADLVDRAVEVGADLVVIGLRRRTQVGKLLLGSSAQRIMLAAPCPVLAVKAD